RSGRLTPGDDLVYCPDQPIQCLARGDRQRVRWRDGNDRMAGGSSFAAPRVTAMVAAILSENLEADLAAVHHLLRDRAGHVQEADREAPDRKPTICPTGTRAALYPYTKEMHALVRFRDLLSFGITGVADPPGRRCVGRDAGEVLHLPPVGVTISASLPRALEDADLLVLGYVRKLGAIQRRDVQAEAVSQALDVHADVFGFEEIDCEGHATLHRRASDLGRRLRSPGVGMDDARVWLATPSADGPVDRPVLGVFGTSSAQGKFTLQLALRRELLKRGYRVGQLGTEHHAELFGLDISFPMGYDSRVELPVEYWPEYLDRRLRHLCAQRQPDVLVVGSQSGTVPYDIHDPRTLTLSTLAFLLGTKPDACILVINAIDEADYVQSTIQTLESLSQTRVIALAVSDKQGRDSGGQGVAANQTGDGHAMVEEVTGQLSRLHGRPVFCIGRSEDVCQMTDQVVGTFTQIESKVAA
ncbi:MAG: DUF1611 domain-containing protein, partial [Gemmatimonadetes bacterium]|nr:DUF1611 domain-containing protein [Gemmatimonadota bacterium]